ncbi:MAG: SIS domain-containing protein [Phycisphaerales bacterium]|nr:SIS domain-containing protein [Phycisphaerales bacterium]MCI0630060.1 SIS domain-containing protein [Phycisphaerales bacterium]MCI0677276.1 SIS domain-containing protein [Phycisphaerales bacterium]
MNTQELFAKRIEGSLTAIGSLRGQLAELASIAEAVVERLRAGGTLYTAGNGGSAAQALHLAEELIGRYRGNREPLRAVCLNADSTALTCIGNDFGFDQIFARQCQALLRPGDVLLVMSTSGKSANIVNALRAARSAGAATFGFLGGDGGACREWCDTAILVGSREVVGDSAFIQDAHQVALHLICEKVEQSFRTR